MIVRRLAPPASSLVQVSGAIDSAECQEGHDAQEKEALTGRCENECTGHGVSPVLGCVTLASTGVPGRAKAACPDLDPTAGGGAS